MSSFIDDFSTYTSKALYLAMFHECFIWYKENGLAFNPTKLYMAVLKSVLLGYVVLEFGEETKPQQNWRDP